jgi:hypothetical protein
MAGWGGTMAKINSFNFGFIVVDGKQYVYDVLILPDGTVKEREHSKARLGNHTIGRAEIEELAKTKPETIIVGIGTSGMATVSPDARLYGLEAKLNLVIVPSLEAVEKLNQLVDEGKRVAALIHITC